MTAGEPSLRSAAGRVGLPVRPLPGDDARLPEGRVEGHVPIGRAWVLAAWLAMLPATGVQAEGGEAVRLMSPAQLSGQPSVQQPVQQPVQGAAVRTGPVRADGGIRMAAMFEWPMTDTAEQAPLSETAMTDLAVRTLTMSGVEAGAFGLVVQPLGEGRLRVDHQGARAFNPASTMKLVTTHAALSMLGPDYHWATRFHTRGVLRDGVLTGDLIIQGGGDPRLLIEDLRALMADMRAAGLHTIKGNLVIDDSRFSARAGLSRAFDGDASQAYNVQPYAALMNFKATRLMADPKTRRLTVDPPLADVQLRYDVRVLKGRCRPGLTRLGVKESVGRNGKPVITVKGTQVRACGPQQFYAAVLDHQQFVHGIFKAAWQEMGGKFHGRTLVRSGAAATATPYLTWLSSRNLSDVVHDINKFSNNVMTRMLLLEMAVTQGQGALPADAAGRWLRRWYQEQGLAMPSLVVENGSGLSRRERISARDMVAMLKVAARSETAPWFESSLPVVGIDGTMRTRLRHDPVAGQAQIKTGTLNDVRAIAGYVTAASGQRYAVSLMINGHFEARRALAGQDELLRWIHRHG